MSQDARLRDVPQPAALLGVAGLIPFITGAVGVWIFPLDWADFWLFAMTLYAAIIASFMGAVHWGLALSETAAGREEAKAVTWTRLGLAVLPAILGWMACLAHPLPGLMLLILVFAGIYFADLQSLRNGLLPAWYKPLRKLLTSLVILSLGSALFRVIQAGGPLPGVQ
jgi:hypothetical protein